MFKINYSSYLVDGGLVYIGFGLMVLLTMDIISAVVFNVLVIGNLLVSLLTFNLGIALTVIMRIKSHSKAKLLLIWAIVAVIVWSFELCWTAFLVGDQVSEVYLWIAPLIWRK